MDKATRSFVMNVLRRGTYKHPGRFKALKKAHIGRNQYVCAGCGGVFKKKEINLDHIESVIPLEGTEDFNVIIERMYVGIEGYQVLCCVKSDLNSDPGGCHGVKTAKENEQRRLLKAEKK